MHQVYVKKQVKNVHFFDGVNDSNTDVLPNNVIKWAELKDSNPDILDRPITVLNDNGASFEELADIIEKEL